MTTQRATIEVVLRAPLSASWSLSSLLKLLRRRRGCGAREAFDLAASAIASSPSKRDPSGDMAVSFAGSTPNLECRQRSERTIVARPCRVHVVACNLQCQCNPGAVGPRSRLARVSTWSAESKTSAISRRQAGARATTKIIGLRMACSAPSVEIDGVWSRAVASFGGRLRTCLGRGSVAVDASGCRGPEAIELALQLSAVVLRALEARAQVVTLTSHLLKVLARLCKLSLRVVTG